MRFAVIDLGTNTFNLLVAEATVTGYSIIHSDRIPVRLGKGGINERIIRPDAFERGITAMLTHREKALSLHAEKIFAFATSAVRESANGKEFALQVKEETGISIEIISGDREAELIWKGVTKAMFFSQPRLIMDIGGGSTEFILATDEKIIWKQSYFLGVTRLFELFPHQDPLSETDVEKISSFLKEELQSLFTVCDDHNVRSLVGSAGSFESFADMISWETKGKAHDFSIPSGKVDLQELKILVDEIISSSHQQRLLYKGLPEFRRDLIVMATLLVKVVVENCRVDEVWYSSYALKEGVMSEVLNSIRE